MSESKKSSFWAVARLAWRTSQNAKNTLMNRRSEDMTAAEPITTNRAWILRGNPGPEADTSCVGLVPAYRAYFFVVFAVTFVLQKSS